MRFRSRLQWEVLGRMSIRSRRGVKGDEVPLSPEPSNRMKLEELFEDKTLKAKAKVATIGEALIEGRLSNAELIGFAQKQKPQNCGFSEIGQGG